MIKLVLFDLSRTLLAGSGLNAGAEFLGVTGYRETYKRYKEGRTSEEELVVRTIRDWKGFALADMGRLKIDFNTNALEIISWLHGEGIKTGLVSNAPEPFVAYLAEKLHCSYFKGTACEIAGGIFTGNITSLVPKDVSVKEIIKASGIPASECMAVGDSIADVAMFKAVGIGVAYNADENVRKMAKYSISDFDELIIIIQANS